MRRLVGTGLAVVIALVAVPATASAASRHATAMTTETMPHFGWFLVPNRNGQRVVLAEDVPRARSAWAPTAPAHRAPRAEDPPSRAVHGAAASEVGVLPLTIATLPGRPGFHNVLLVNVRIRQLAVVSCSPSYDVKDC
jgi:hypothetical protein